MNNMALQDRQEQCRSPHPIGVRRRIGVGWRIGAN